MSSSRIDDVIHFEALEANLDVLMLLVFYQCCVSQVFHQHFTLFQCFSTVSPVFYQCFVSVSSVFRHWCIRSARFEGLRYTDKFITSVRRKFNSLRNSLKFNSLGNSSMFCQYFTGCLVKLYPLLFFEFLGFLGVEKFRLGHLSTALSV